MVNKIQSNAFETRYVGIKSEVITPLGFSLIQRKMKLLKKGLIFPDSLIREIENYVKRNEIIKEVYIEDFDNLYKCCPSCLKAHTLKKAREIGLDNLSIHLLANIFEGEIGHNGYYLDEEELIKFEED